MLTFRCSRSARCKALFAMTEHKKLLLEILSCSLIGVLITFTLFPPDLYPNSVSRARYACINLLSSYYRAQLLHSSMDGQFNERLQVSTFEGKNEILQIAYQRVLTAGYECHFNVARSEFGVVCKKQDGFKSHFLYWIDETGIIRLGFGSVSKSSPILELNESDLK